jgi:hypothetical protein
MSKAETPNRSDISQLPHLAQVAFTARCARRLKPLFSMAWTNAQQDDIDVLENAISFAEKFSRGSIANPRCQESISIAIRYAAAARLVVEKIGKAHINHVNAAVADAAARAAMHAANSVIDKATAMVSAERAAAASTINVNFREILISEIRNDFEILKETSKKNSWKDETPIPLNLFGNCIKHNLSSPNLPQYNKILTRQLNGFGKEDIEKDEIFPSSIHGLIGKEENFQSSPDPDKNPALSLLMETLKGLKDSIQPAKLGLSMFLRGKGGQQIARVEEILTNNIEKICSVQIEIQKLINAHIQKMYELQTERRKQRAQNIRILVESYLRVRDTNNDADANQVKRLIFSNLQDELLL